MPQEIEIKMRLNDAAAVEAKLKSLGALPVVQLHERNTFLDTPQATLRQGDQALRVRVETDRQSGSPRDVIITHKGPRNPGQVKSRAETELHVQDASQAIALLEALGYAPTLTFEKHRDRWAWGGCHIELDSLPMIGRFVEIEGPDEAAIMHVREALGMRDTPIEPMGYAALLGRELDRLGITSRDVRFT